MAYSLLEILVLLKKEINNKQIKKQMKKKANKYKNK